MEQKKAEEEVKARKFEVRAAEVAATLQLELNEQGGGGSGLDPAIGEDAELYRQLQEKERQKMMASGAAIVVGGLPKQLGDLSLHDSSVTDSSPESASVSPSALTPDGSQSVRLVILVMLGNVRHQNHKFLPS